MSLKLYLDVHVPRAVTVAVRLRGIDVLTAQEDGASELTDSDLLDRATALDRVLFSQDDDLLKEAAKRQRSGQRFAGVLYAHQLNITIGRCVDDLVLIGSVGEPVDMESRVEFLPFR